MALIDREVIQKAMKRLGWDFVSIGIDEMEWRKFDSSGGALAVHGDSTWIADLSRVTLGRGVEEQEKKLDIVRVLRVLEYIGPRKWVDECLDKRGVKEILRINDHTWISEGFLGRVPESVIRDQLKPLPPILPPEGSDESLAPVHDD